jgi:hypothetical protein
VWLDILVTLGPLFSLSRLVGKKRMLHFENWLMGRYLALVRLYRHLLDIGRFVVPTFVIPELVGLGAAIPYFVGAQVTEPSPYADDSEVIGFLIIMLLVLGISLLVSFLFWRWANRFMYKRMRAFRLAWRRKYAVRPPWLLNGLRGRFDHRRAFWYRYWFPMTLLVYMIAVPLSWLTTVVLMAPLWLIEQLRRRINPDSESYLDMTAYIISFAAMARKIWLAA